MKKIILLIVVIVFTSTPARAISASEITNDDIEWLTLNIYHEARGESINGQIMVAIVTLERLDDGRWGNTIKDVVTSYRQFSWYWDGRSDRVDDRSAWNVCKVSAYIAINVHSIIKGTKCMFYHEKSIEPNWLPLMTRMFQMGNHIFYRERI